MVFGMLGDHYAIDQYAGNPNLPRGQGMGVGDPFDLGDHDAATVAGRHGDRQGFQGECFALHGQVAFDVGGGRPDQGDIDREGFVEQIGFVAQADRFDPILDGAGIQPAAAMTGIDEGVQPDSGKVTGFAGGDVAKQMGDDALGQVPGFDAVLDGESLQGRNQAPVAADHSCDQAVVAEMVESATVAVALAGGIDQGQVAWLSSVEEAPLKRHGQTLGEADSDEAAGGDRVAVADQAHRLIGADALAVGFECRHAFGGRGVVVHVVTGGSARGCRSLPMLPWSSGDSACRRQVGTGPMYRCRIAFMALASG